MKLRDIGSEATRDWFAQLLEWSRRKVSIDDNMDCTTVTAYVGTTETEVGHSLGRVPRYVIPVMAYPYGTGEMSFTKEPNNEKLFLSRRVAGTCTLLVF